MKQIVNLLSRSMYADIVTVVVILLIIFLVRTVGYGLYRVPTESMESTMLVGEYFFSNKATLLFSAPRHGDIVAFNDPLYVYSNNAIMRLIEQYLWGPESWSKRIIGIPGDTIQGIIENNIPVLLRNGIKLQERYVYPYSWSAVDVFKVTLKEGQYWVMGDNRGNSFDSRSFGPLDGQLIHGKIMYRLFSIDMAGAWILPFILAHPILCWKLVRWQRCMERVV